MSWIKFIENFQGKKIEEEVSCENGMGVCKKEKYAIKVYRCIWKNKWVDNLGKEISEPFEALCTPSFGSNIYCNTWIENTVQNDGSIIYSYYIKTESCESFVEVPNFPETKNINNNNILKYSFIQKSISKVEPIPTPTPTPEKK